MRFLRYARFVSWAMVVLLLVAAGFLLWRGGGPLVVQEGSPLGGPFTLMDTTGKAVTETIFKGRAHAVFFGFTHCPDVCPTTLSEMTVLLDEMGEAGAKLDVYFVTVDPERDTAAKLANYLSPFSGRIKGLTGTEAQIQGMADHYRVYRRKVPTDDGGYTMDHTAAVFLFDSTGDFRGTISYGEAQSDALAKLKRLTGGA